MTLLSLAARVEALPPLSFATAKAAGEAMFDRWKAMADSEPPLTREDAAWADMFRAGYDSARAALSDMEKDDDLQA